MSAVVSARSLDLWQAWGAIRLGGWVGGWVRGAGGWGAGGGEGGGADVFIVWADSGTGPQGCNCCHYGSCKSWL